jgi:hypothetical protein
MSPLKWSQEEDAIGYIWYSDTGVMAVQISRKSRTEIRELFGTEAR